MWGKDKNLCFPNMMLKYWKVFVHCLEQVVSFAISPTISTEDKIMQSHKCYIEKT